MARSVDDIRRDVNVAAAQRGLKVLGIFARLRWRDNKPSYLSNMPLVYENLLSACRALPSLSELAEVIEEGAAAMRAMILAAGRGERLRPLTDRIPKPLADIGGEPVIVRHIKNLKRCGFEEMVVNTSHLAAMIQKRLGDGREWGARIAYSHRAAGAGIGGPESVRRWRAVCCCPKSRLFW